MFTISVCFYLWFWKNPKIQGVHQNCFCFCLLIFSASLGSRNSILGIFQQPFPCRFQKYPIYYYLWEMWVRLLYHHYTVFHSFSANLQAVCTTIDKDTLNKHMQYIETGLDTRFGKWKLENWMLLIRGITYYITGLVFAMRKNF